MGKFNKRDNNFSGRGGDRRGGFGGSGGGMMHQATCSECGKSCEVPFKPTGEKPIYCNDCFRNKRGGEQRGPSSGGRRDSNRFGSNSSDRVMHQAICDKCGKSCEVPFKPTGEKPIYCSNCFDRGDRGDRGSRNEGSSQTSKQLEMINQKLDKLLRVLVPQVSTEIPAIKSEKKDIPTKKEKKETSKEIETKASPKVAKVKAKAVKAKAKATPKKKK